MSELSKQALKVENNTQFPNNNNGAITPSDLRAFNVDMIDSTVNQTQYDTDSGSWNAQINALEAFTGSQQPSFNALNQFTASQLVINTGVNGFTGSANARLNTLESETLNLEAFTASVNQIADNGVVQGVSTRLHFYGLVSASIVPNVNGPIAAINVEQDGTKADTASFNSYTASTDSDLDSIHSATASLNAFTASLATTFVSTASFNSYTASTNGRLNNIENTTASLLIETSNLELFSASALISISNLNTFTQSANTQLTNLASSQSIDNAKWNTLGGQSGSWITESETASFARYDVSNPWSADQTFTNISAVSASFTYVKTLIETASVIYSSGSNQFGDALNDTQILSGSVLIVGSGSINGSRIITSADTASMSVLNALTSSITRNVIVVARNGGASTLAAGTVVHITSAVGDNPVFTTASYDTEALSSNTFGLLRYSSLSGADVEVVVSGIVTGVNTDPALGYAAGDIIYLSSSGQFTKVQPQAPNQIVALGQVLRAQQNNGSIYVSINNGWELDELHNVQITNPQTGDLIQYESSSYGLWKNKSIVAAGITTTSSFNAATASLQASASLALVTASFSGNTITFTKGDASTFGVVIPDVSGSTIDTGSFATTGSNTFNGNQTVNGGISGSGLQIHSAVNLGSTAYLRFESGSGGSDYYNIQLIPGDGSMAFSRDGASNVKVLTLAGSAGQKTIFQNNEVNFSSNVSQVSFDAPIALGASIISPVLITGSITTTDYANIGGALSASLPQGYVWVGDASNRTAIVPTASFAGASANTGSLLTTASFFGAANLRFTKGDGSTFDVEGFVNTGSSQIYGTMTFEDDSNAQARWNMSGSAWVGIQKQVGINRLIWVDNTNDKLLSLDVDTRTFSVSGAFNAGLQQGYAWVGDSTGRSIEVPTSSFAGGGSIPAGTISGSQQITDLGFVSSSVTASSLITASVSLNTITFTKGDNTTFALTVDTGSGGGGGGQTFANPSLESISGSLLISALGFTSGAANLLHLTASNQNQANLVFKNNNNTGTTFITGSSNMYTNPAAPAAGYIRYVGGSSNLFLNGNRDTTVTVVLPSITGSAASVSGVRPAMNANILIGNPVVTINQSTAPGQHTYSNNIIGGNLTINALGLVGSGAQLGRLDYTGNTNFGTVTLNMASRSIAEINAGATGSARANITNNYIAGTFTYNGPVSASATAQIHTISGNNIAGTALFNVQSGSRTYSITNNSLNGTLTINDNTVFAPTLGGTQTYSNNIINGIATFALAGSSSFNVSNNNLNSVTITSFLDASAIATAGARNSVIGNNAIFGVSNNVLFSGSQGAAPTGRVFQNNLIAGTLISASLVGDGTNDNMISTAILGAGLNVYGTSDIPATTITQNIGSAFFGRWNAEDGNRAKTAETIFAVGTGNSGSAGIVRKTGFLIDSGSNIYAEGTFNVSGSTTFNGSAVVTGSVTVSNVIQLGQLDPLPTGADGQLAVSASQLWFYSGSAWNKVFG